MTVVVAAPASSCCPGEGSETATVVATAVRANGLGGVLEFGWLGARIGVKEAMAPALVLGSARMSGHRCWDRGKIRNGHGWQL